MVSGSVLGRNPENEQISEFIYPNYEETAWMRLIPANSIIMCERQFESGVRCMVPYLRFVPVVFFVHSDILFFFVVYYYILINP